jgi:flagellar basal-body rod protein FlgB
MTMSNSLFVDNAYQAAKLALDGLSMRQQSITRNLANVDTPGYQAQTVDFETAIRRALQDAESGSFKMASPTLSAFEDASAGFKSLMRTGGSERADGNNVDIDTELMDMSVTGIQYQAISQEVSKKLQLLKAIAQAR